MTSSEAVEPVPDEDNDQSHLLSGIQSVETGPFDFIHRDPHAETIGLIPELFKRSREGAHALAQSYRGFRVGAAAVAYDFSTERPRRGIYTAGNYKADSDSSKVCAEMDILLRAEEEGFEWIGAIVIAGTTNRERIQAVTGVSSATLHPCEDCGRIFRCHPLIDRYTALFTTGSAAEFGKYQLQSHEEYARRYEPHWRGEGFEDAETRDYIASEWPYRQDLYLRQAKRDMISGPVYIGGDRKQSARRALMMKIMGTPLEFEQAI